MNRKIVSTATLEASNKLPCTHCGSEVTGSLKTNHTPGDPAFCCAGCRAVYSLLTTSGLGRYYDLKKQVSTLSLVKPKSKTEESFQYLDDPEFLKKYAHFRGSPNSCSMDFYLEGVHCVACLWLVENLPQLVNDVESASLDIGKGIARVNIKQNRSFASAARALAEIGYNPHPVEFDEQAELYQKNENRADMKRIGIAGASAGNIMLMAIPLYSGLTGQTAIYFRWVSFLLYLPIMFYGALPFYKNALTSLRTKTMSIDLPIVIALLFGTIASIAHIQNESEHIYFDSLAALVFLLLASRFALKRIQQNAFYTSHLFQFLSPSGAKKIDPTTEVVSEVATSSLKAGDHILVNRNEVIPADGLIRRGTSAINCALLTGESTPQVLKENNTVYSGTVNEGDNLIIEVTAVGSHTKLGQILKDVEKSSTQRSKTVNAADKTAKWFLAAVLLASVAAVFLAPTLSEGLSRALALAIVTCPCALALATPLTMTVALSRAARAGLLIKSADVLERLNQVKDVVLDKTGTLTQGRLRVSEFKQIKETPNLKEIIVALESCSTHPVAKAITLHFKEDVRPGNFVLADFKQNLGDGVEGRVNGVHYKLSALRDNAGTAVGVYKNGFRVAEVYLDDEIRSESKACVASLKSLGLNPFIASGDNKYAAESVALSVGISPEHTLSSADPSEKQSFIKCLERPLMVGDGANDATALTSAHVGVAVQGSMEVSLRAADVYLTRPGLNPIIQLLIVSRETMHTIYRNFAFSLIYNLIGGIAAATGHVTPLFAALLMPTSAFTVFASSLLGTRKMRKTLKDGPHL